MHLLLGKTRVFHCHVSFRGGSLNCPRFFGEIPAIKTRLKALATGPLSTCPGSLTTSRPWIQNQKPLDNCIISKKQHEDTNYGMHAYIHICMCIKKVISIESNDAFCQFKL